MSTWNDTLIPNVGPHHWVANSSIESRNASDADLSVRPIGIVFFLEDPRARTQHVYVIPEKRKEYHCDDEGQTANIWLEENEEGLLSAITIGIDDKTTESAFKRASSIVYSMLSLWAYQYKRPFSIQEIKLRDVNHEARWIIPKFCPKALPLKVVSQSFGEGSPVGALFALFREGMNSTSSAYRFLSYFKIAEAWKNNKGPFSWLIEKSKQKGINPTFPTRIVTKDLLAGSYKSTYHDDFIDKKFTWCVDELAHLRLLIAHPFTHNSQFANLDSPEVQAYLSALANLIERIAIQLLEDYLETWEKVDDSGEVRQMRKMYSHID